MADVAHRPRALVGVASAAVALGVTQLVAVAFGPEADSRTAVGSAVIDLTPGPVKEWAIQTFGTADKLFLSVMVLAMIAVIAAVAARWERSPIPVGSIVIACAGIAGAAAVLSREGASLLDVVPTAVGAICGIATLRFLTSGRLSDGDDGVAARASTEVPGTDDGQPADPGRRLSLAAMGFLGAGVLSGVIGMVVSRQLHSVSGDREAFTPPAIPKPIRTPAALGSACGGCPAQFRDEQRRLLPDRHGVERPAAQP